MVARLRPHRLQPPVACRVFRQQAYRLGGTGVGRLALIRTGKKTQDVSYLGSFQPSGVRAQPFEYLVMLLFRLLFIYFRVAVSLAFYILPGCFFACFSYTSGLIFHLLFVYFRVAFSLAFDTLPVAFSPAFHVLPGCFFTRFSCTSGLFFTWFSYTSGLLFHLLFIYFRVAFSPAFIYV